MTDTDDVRRLDDEEIDRLWSSIHSPVRRELKSDDVAEDIVQQSWLLSLTHPPRRRDRLAAWLSTVAKRLIFAHSRSRRARFTREQAVARSERVLPPDEDRDPLLADPAIAALGLNEQWLDQLDEEALTISMTAQHLVS